MTARTRCSPRVVFPIAIGVLMLACPLLQTRVHAQAAFVTENGITFGKGGDTELKLDLARPKEGAGPFPALVFIHGGSWIVGTRQDFDYVAQQAAEKGYVAV